MCSVCSLELILTCQSGMKHNQLIGTGFEEGAKRTALVMSDPEKSEEPKRALRR